MKRRTLVGAALAAPVALAAPRVVRAADPLKIGYVYVGPVGDLGWSFQHDQGRLAVEKALGAKVQTSYVESVSEGADAERVIRQLASTGHKLIFTTSFGYMNATLKVAQQFPDVIFEHCTGYKRAKNVGTYNGRFYEGRYVMGYLAGKVTRTKKIGYIASFPIPEVIMGINAYTLGAQRHVPDIDTKIVWVNSWYDPGKETEAANALIDQGIDFLVQHTDSPAPVQAAEARGVLCVGQASDMARFGPTKLVSSVVDDWASHYIKSAERVLAGTWVSEDYWGGIAENSVVITPWGPAVPPELIPELDALVQSIRDRSFHPFTGPIRNQAGEVTVPEGQVIADADLLAMNYYVQGIQGAIPG